MAAPTKNSKSKKVQKAYKLCDQKQKDFKKEYEKKDRKIRFEVMNKENAEFEAWLQDMIVDQMILDMI